MICPHCNKEFFFKADTCPHCGKNLEGYTQRTDDGANWLKLFLLVPVIVIGLLIIGFIVIIFVLAFMFRDFQGWGAT